MQNVKLPFLFQKNRLVFLISVLLLAGFLATSLVSYFVFKASIKKDILSNQLPLTSDNIYSEIQNDLLTPILVSSLMASDTFVRDWVLEGEKDVKKMINYLNGMKEKYNAITSFFVSERTRIYYHFKGNLKQVSEDEPRDKWYFRVRTMEENFETNIDPDDANEDSMTIFINYKVFDYDGNFVGVTGIGLSVNSATKLIKDYQRLYNRQVYFVGRDGAVILSGENSMAPGLNILDQPSLRGIAKEILKSEKGSFEYVKNGKTILLNTRFIPELDWYVFVEQIEGAMAELPKTLILNFGIGFAIMSVILFATTYTIRVYQRQIEKDSTKLYQINQELEKSKTKAEAASIAKGEFLASMSHEIRTPMSGLLGISELLLMSKLSPEQQKQVETIQKSGEALLSILNNILDFSKVEAGKLELEKTDFHLHQLLNEMELFFMEACRKKGITFHIRISPGVPQMIRGDVLRLRQILINLLSNAVKFTEKGGVTLNVEPESELPFRVCFEIKDTGIGVAPEKLEKLFQPFTQVDSSTTRKYGGTGLGLSIVHKLVELMGGDIRAQSEPQKGSAFTATLPLEEAHKESAPQTEPSSTEDVFDPEARILLVEDDPVNQVVFLSMLKHLGLNAELAWNGLEALETLKKKSFDLVFMDCNMPEMDGFSACRAFRAWEKSNGQGAYTPIVALTAYAMQRDREKCMAAGMDDYLTKPIRGKVLKSALSRWLGLHYKSETFGTTSSRGQETTDLRKALQKIKRDFGEKAAGIIQVFQDILPQQINALHRSMEEKAFVDLSREAHSLKGASLSLGFVRLGELAGEVETMGEAGHLQGAEELFARLETEASLVREAMKKEI